MVTCTGFGSKNKSFVEEHENKFYNLQGINRFWQNIRASLIIYRKNRKQIDIRRFPCVTLFFV